MKHLKHLKLFESWDDPTEVNLNKFITDKRGTYDKTDSHVVDANALAKIVKKVFKKYSININSMELNSDNKFDGYNFRILSSYGKKNVNIFLRVNTGHVGLDDHRGGSIEIYYPIKVTINKRSKQFGDVKIDIGEYEKEIENAFITQAKNIIT